MVEEHLGHGSFGLAVGELELGVLELDDLLAEGLTLLGVVDGQFQRALHHRNRVHGDD